MCLYFRREGGRAGKKERSQCQSNRDLTKRGFFLSFEPMRAPRIFHLSSVESIRSRQMLYFYLGAEGGGESEPRNEAKEIIQVAGSLIKRNDTSRQKLPSRHHVGTWHGRWSGPSLQPSLTHPADPRAPPRFQFAATRLKRRHAVNFNIIASFLEAIGFHPRLDSGCDRC